jgi:hypothetical protein
MDRFSDEQRGRPIVADVEGVKEASKNFYVALSGARQW